MSVRLPKRSWWRGLALSGGLGLVGCLNATPGGAAPQAPPPPDRLLRALDMDGDGKLSPEEIMSASDSLKNIDDDKDGTLSNEELRPPRGEGRRPPRPRAARGTNPRARSTTPSRAGEETVELVIRGGHDTDPRDHGRPVALVAGGLGVSPDVFRNAFSRVRPAPGGTEPDPRQVRENKSVLLAALGPLGITNDELDRVSNYYRYNPGRGRLWPARPAAGYAVIKAGAVTSVVITEPGSGYNSPPAISVPGHTEVVFNARLNFGPDLENNGSVASVIPATGKPGPRG